MCPSCFPWFAQPHTATVQHHKHHCQWPMQSTQALWRPFVLDLYSNTPSLLYQSSHVHQILKPAGVHTCYCFQESTTTPYHPPIAPLVELQPSPPLLLLLLNSLVSPASDWVTVWGLATLLSWGLHWTLGYCPLIINYRALLPHLEQARLGMSLAH